jgi:ATP phosphoribosyltransferase
MRRERAVSGQTTPLSGETEASYQTDSQLGVEEILDLSFGACKLQVQVPEKGKYVKPSDLIGKNIGTSFVRLAEDYFAALENEADGISVNGSSAPSKAKLRTKIIELSGSVEAACALGVADGIVDLVGMVPSDRKNDMRTNTSRIRRDNEGCRSQGN